MVEKTLPSPATVLWSMSGAGWLRHLCVIPNGVDSR